MHIVLIDDDINRSDTIASELMHFGMVKVFRVNANGSGISLPKKFDIIILLAEKVTAEIEAQLSDIEPNNIVALKKYTEKFQWNDESVMVVEDLKRTKLAQRILNHCKGLYYFHLLNIGNDRATCSALNKLTKYAASMVPILISGETGTGKEIAAKYIHYISSLRDGPFVALNCAAIPESMFEAILFGHEKGAFTSAVQTYVGKIEQANNGTLLLDEISELPLVLQAKLLRVIQEKEVEKIGGSESVRLNFRIIATTNKDLRELVGQGVFRNDLFYRLNVAMYEPIPLRMKPSDIVSIATYLLAYHSLQQQKQGLSFSAAAENKIQGYKWPGNIRELENVIQKAIILDQDNVIDVDDIDLDEGAGDMSDVKWASPLQESEAHKIMDVLKETDGRRDVAAKILNISARTLRNKISKLREIGFQVP